MTSYNSNNNNSNNNSNNNYSRTVIDKRWPFFLNDGLNAVTQRDAVNRKLLWEHVAKQNIVMAKLNEANDNGDNQQIVSILQVQANTALKGPAKNERAALKGVAKAKAKAASKPRQGVSTAYHGNEFSSASVVEHHCLQYEDGTAAERNWYEADLGSEAGYWLLGKAAAVKFMKQVFKTCNDPDVQYCNTAIIISATLQQFEHDDDLGRFSKAFSPREIQLTLFSEKDRKRPRTTQKCVLLHLGGSMLNFVEESIPTVELTTPESVEVTLKVYQREVAKETWTSLAGTMRPTVFHKLATRAVGVDNIFGKDTAQIAKEYPKKPDQKKKVDP